MSAAASVDAMRSTNWSGSIPVVLSLAPTSLSSPTIPPPVHVLLPRHTFLHVGLRSAVLRLAAFAPTVHTFAHQQQQQYANGNSSSSSSLVMRNEPDPGGMESENLPSAEPITKTTTSTSSTSSAQRPNNNNNNNDQHYPICWFEDEEAQIPLRWHLFAGILFDLTRKRHNSSTSETTSTTTSLPWKIRLHFSSYPSSQLLPLDAEDGVWCTVERSFKNALKQALFLQHGNSRVAMNLTKQSHQRIWDSVVAANYQWYRQVNGDLQQNDPELLQLLPVRLLVDSQPPQQRPCHPYVVEGSNRHSAVPLTLGMLLCDWVPQYFPDSPDETSKSSVITWWIGGITPPLSSRILDLWKHLCHPDHILYIVLLTKPV